MATLYPGLGRHLPLEEEPRDPLEEFYALLEACKMKSVIHTPHREFIQVSRLLTWFRSHWKHETRKTNAGRVLMAVYGSNDPPNLIHDLLQVMMPGEQCWLKIFIILLQLNKGTYIEKFWNLGIVDQRLPIGVEELRSKIYNMFGPLDDEAYKFANDFFELQFQLLAKDSLDSTNGRILDPVHILPVCKMDPIKPGGSGKIFQIEVPCDCVCTNILKKIRSKPYKKDGQDGQHYHEFALKVLKDEVDYEQETFAYSALRGREGIVQCLGFWEIKKSPKESEFHLLLEYGYYDLDEYFENFPPPSLPCDIIKFWEELSNVAIALDKIHNMISIVEGRTTLYYGWHGDIKPENILFCEGKWKIADPGFARVVQQDRTKFDDIGLPVITLRGGTKTYGPPEQAIVPKQPVTQRFDIWSLGCVFSEAAAWVLLGYRGVEQFRLVRKSVEIGNRNSIQLEDIQGDDCFHNNTDVSPAVIAWHDYLKNSLRDGDRVTRSILDLIENKMLVQSRKDRASSSELVHQLKSILEKAERDESLSKYRPPSYFRIAFEAEQRKAAEDWSNPSGRIQPRKSNRYKSTRFQNSPGNLPGPNESPYGRPHIHTPLLTAFPESNQSTESGLHRTYTPPDRRTQNSLSLTTQESLSVYDNNRRQSSPYGDLGDGDRFDYWDALYLVESQGWLSTGTLERPQKPLALPSPPMHAERGKAIERTPTFQRSSTRSSNKWYHSTSGKSLFSQRLSKGVKPADMSRPKNVPATAPASGPRQISSAGSSSKVEVDSKYRMNDLDEYFDKRDIVFLLDNGSTMAKHWPRVRDLVAVLVTLLHGQDDDGMELYFTSSTKKYGPYSEPKDFVDRINEKKPKEKGEENVQKQTEDDIREVLFHILNLVGKPTYERKLTLIILTDGIWKDISQKRTVANGIVHWLERWEDRQSLKDMLRQRGLSIQFVQFGDDEDATREFDYMDNRLVKSDGTKLPDIIDVEPATGNIRKMILGSLSTKWDGPPTLASNDSQSSIGQGEWMGHGSESSNINSPPQGQNSRFSDFVEEPSDYVQSRKSYNPGRDTDYSGSQFGQPASPTQIRPAATFPRRVMNQERSPTRKGTGG